MVLQDSTTLWQLNCSRQHFVYEFVRCVSVNAGTDSRRRWLLWWVTGVGQHSQLVSNFHDASLLLVTNRPDATWALKAQGISSCKAATCKPSKHAPPHVRSVCVKMRSETKQRFTARHNHGSQLWASLCVPWTIPGARQVFQAAGSERQASAMQIHHLSLPLLENQIQPLH